MALFGMIISGKWDAITAHEAASQRNGQLWTVEEILICDYWTDDKDNKSKHILIFDYYIMNP